MAGQPKTRAKKAAQAAGDIPEAREEDSAPARDTTARHTHARTRTRAPRAPTPRVSANSTAAPASVDAGPQVRARIDQHRAGIVEALQRELAPGMVVRIERTRPTWCAGYLEDWQLEEGTLGELFEYIREEHGGQRYTLSVLSPNGVPLIQMSQPFSGPPRQQGRPINRAQWDAEMRGEVYDPRQPAGAPPGYYPPGHYPPQPQQPAAAPQGIGLAEVLTILDKANDRQFEAVKGAAEAQSRTHSELMAALAKRDEGGSFLGQLAGIKQSVAAIREIEDELTPEAPPADDGPQPDSMGKEVMKAIMMKQLGMGAGGGGGGGGASPFPAGFGGPPGAPRYPRRDGAPSKAPADSNVIPFAREAEE